MFSSDFKFEDLARFIENEITSGEKALYLQHFYLSTEKDDSRTNAEKILDIFLPNEDTDAKTLQNLLANHSVICCTNEMMVNKWQLRPVPDFGLSNYFFTSFLYVKLIFESSFLDELERKALNLSSLPIMKVLPGKLSTDIVWDLNVASYRRNYRIDAHHEGFQRSSDAGSNYVSNVMTLEHDF